MNGVMPEWLERWLGIQADGSGEGTLWRLDHDWRWPAWATLLLMGCAAAHVALLYSRERRSAGSVARAMLAVLRMASIAIVLWMIAAWVLALDRSGLPYAVILVDDSASMATVDLYEDQALKKALERYVRTASTQAPSRLDVAKGVLHADGAAGLRRIAAQQRLKLYAVSTAARPFDGDVDVLLKSLDSAEPLGEASRLGEGLRTVLNDLRGVPPAAIVLLSDGVNTAGESLADAAAYAHRKGVPLYTVAVGSSEPVKDVQLDDLLVDDVVFVGDVVNFEFSVSATGFTAAPAKAELVNAQTGAVLAEQPLTLGDDGQPQRARIAYRPPEEGEFEFTVRIPPLAGEAKLDNNAETRHVQVRKEKLRVLIVWWQPSLEFRRLKALLEREPTVELKTVLQDADLEYAESDRTALKVFPTDRDALYQYDVVVFGDANPAFLSGDSLELLRDFVARKGGGLVVVAGPHFTPHAFAGTPLDAILPIESDPAASRLALPAIESFAPSLTDLGLVSPGCQIGGTPHETEAIWKELPDWYWYHPSGRARPAARVLLEHPTRQGLDGRPMPLAATQFVGAGKVLYHASDETYRWRFRVGDLYFGRYWLQSIRYLSRSKLANENRIAELTSDRREYRRNEPVRLRVRFTDDRAAPAEDDGVELVVERDGQRLQNMKLARTLAVRGVFEGALAQLAEGKYHVWIAAPSFTGRAPSADFRVVPPPGETERIEADVAELRRAAELARGRFYTLANVDRLWRDLPAGRQIPVESLPPLPLWNQWPVLCLALTLLITEWAVRKRKGLL